MNQMTKNQRGGDNTINILCATDEKYAPYCGVMLTSFLENHKAFHTEVFIIVKSRMKAGKKLHRLEERYDVNVNIIEFPFKDVVSNFPLNVTYLSLETYYRLFAAELLPKELDRILYLDCDIIVDGDVSEIYFSDMVSISAFVVEDIPENILISHPERLGYPKEKGYFNAGVMMINLSYWREHNILKRSIVYIKNHHDILIYNDQDVLNVILQDSKKNVSLIYNFQHLAVLKKNYDKYDNKTKTVINTQNPKIIHYVSGLKPWTIYSYKFPFTAIWDKYCSMSLWRLPLFKQLPKEKPFNYFIKRYFLWPFGIMMSGREVADSISQRFK